MIQLHIAVVLFGLAGLIGKTTGLPALVLVAGRTLWAAAALVVILWATGSSAPKQSARQTGALILQGALLAAHWVAFFHSIQISSIAVGLISFSTFPLFVIFLEPMVSEERLRKRDVLAAAVVSVALVFVVPDLRLENDVTQGALWGVGSGVLFAILALLNKRCVQDFSPLLLAFYQNSGAALLLLPFTAWSLTALTVDQQLRLAVLGVLCTALAHSLFLRALKKVPARIAGIVTGLESVYGAAFGYLFLHEVPAERTILGGLVVLVVVTLLQLDHSSRPQQETSRTAPDRAIGRTSAFS
ncbi:MAG: DMT family transporter [Bdellovibrionota bacterium]